MVSSIPGPGFSSYAGNTPMGGALATGSGFRFTLHKPRFILKPDCECTEEELHQHCREHLREFKTPKVIKVMHALPKGPSGKIQRLKLSEMVKP